MERIRFYARYGIPNRIKFSKVFGVGVDFDTSETVL